MKSKKWTPWLWRFLIILLMVYAYGPTHWQRLKATADVTLYNDDVRQQIFPLMRYEDPTLFANDIIVDYHLDCMPLGYKTYYWLGARIFDPRAISRWSFWPLYLVVLLGLTLSGRKLAGETGLWLAMGITLAIPIFDQHMTSTLPRAFGYPCLVLFAWALLHSRPFVMALAVVLGALFYPNVCAIAGLVFAGYMLLFPARLRTLAPWWTTPRRWGLVVGTALLCVACVIPVWMATSEYGKKLGTGDIAQFPEYDRGGRYLDSDTYPFESPWQSISRTAFSCTSNSLTQVTWPLWGLPMHRSIDGKLLTIASISCMVLLGISLVYGGMVFRRNILIARLLLFVPVGLCLFYLAIWLLPYFHFPSRYIEYPLPILVVLMVTAMLGDIRDRLVKHKSDSSASGKLPKVFVAILCLVIVAGVWSRNCGLAGMFRCNPKANGMLRFIGELPSDVLICGWMHSAIEDIPYLTKKSILIGRDQHQVFHKGYVLEMRKRANAVIDATWPQTSHDLTRLWEDWGCTHMVLFKDPKMTSNWNYFKPFDSRIKERRTGIDLIGEFSTRWPDTLVYQDDVCVIVDLKMLAAKLSKD